MGEGGAGGCKAAGQSEHVLEGGDTGSEEAARRQLLGETLESEENINEKKREIKEKG